MEGKKKVKQQKRRESLTPEEILARQAKARFRFRALIRFVVRNLYWLQDVEDEELGEDIQKNILLLTRKKESLLSLTDKAILNKPAQDRTVEEKQHLSRILGGLKCFRRYPPNVKAKLAGVSYFFYFGPGRTIVRQGDESHSLYFVTSGEVTVSQESFDPVLNELVRQDIATMGPGSMFGEVALLHDIPRTATIISNTHVELLCLKKHDFDIILKGTVQKQWEQVKKAMGAFSYFDDWDEISIRECCILSKMKIFIPEQTILGDGQGLRDYVYFILKGKCRVIEHLLTTSSVKNGVKRHKMYIPPPQVDTTVVVIKAEPSKGEVKEDGTKTAEQSQSHTSLHAESGSKTKVTDERVRIEEDLNRIVSGKIDTISKQGMNKKESSMHHPLVGEKKSAASNRDIGRRQSITFPAVNLSTKPVQKVSVVDLPEEVETHFMQVCFLNPLACFGIGENLAHRRVVAVTHTECLLIPRYWLLQKNKGNIWNRVQQYLNNHIPSTKQIFKEFVNQRKWMAHRGQMTEDILASRQLSNDNTLTNCPYFIRIHEGINFD